MPEDFARINLTVPRQVHDELTKNIPKGLRNNAYLCVISKLAELLESEGTSALVKILDGKFEIELYEETRE